MEICQASGPSAPRLEERDWSMVSDNNGLCYGTVIVRKTVDWKILAVGVERARYPVFRFKPRMFLSDMVASTAMKDIEMDLRIPEYIVDDQSYVSSYETANSLQSSMAESSFTETDVAAAVSGSAFGCSLSASASYGESEKKAETSASDNKNKTVTVAYNFPRVTLILDADDLELTPQSQRALLKVKDRQTLTSFLDRYGEFFSTRVQLGGRLHTSEELDSSSSSKSSETIKAMKAAAAVAFSGWGASASVSASHNEQSQKSSAAAAVGSSIALTWQANGGDTLLCNDPKAWSPTVALHDYWRVTKRDRVVHLVDLLGKFQGFEGLPAKIVQWTTDPPRTVPLIPKPYFTLRDFDVTEGNFMDMTDPKDVSIAEAVKAVNWDYETTPSHKKKGCVILGSGRDQDRNNTTFILETPQGSTVSQPCFQTLYHLKHAKKKLYVDMCTEDPYPLLFANESKGFRMRFVDAWRKELTGPISDGASVKIQFFANDVGSAPGANMGTVFKSDLGYRAKALMVDTLAMILNTNLRSQKFVFEYMEPEQSYGAGTI